MDVTMLGGSAPDGNALAAQRVKDGLAFFLASVDGLSGLMLQHEQQIDQSLAATIRTALEANIARLEGIQLRYGKGGRIFPDVKFGSQGPSTFNPVADQTPAAYPQELMPKLLQGVKFITPAGFEVPPSAVPAWLQELSGSQPANGGESLDPCPCPACTLERAMAKQAAQQAAAHDPQSPQPTHEFTSRLIDWDYLQKRGTAAALVCLAVCGVMSAIAGIIDAIRN